MLRQILITVLSLSVVSQCVLSPAIGQVRKTAASAMAFATAGRPTANVYSCTNTVPCVAGFAAFAPSQAVGRTP